VTFLIVIVHFRSTAVVTLVVCLWQILIGNAYYNCSCVRYVTSNLWLIVGLTVGSFLLVAIFVAVIVVACRRRCRKSKPKTEHGVAANNYDNGARCIELDEEDRYYSSIDLPVAEANNNADTYCRPLPAEPEQNKEYSALAEPEPTSTNSPYYLALKTDDTC